MSGRYNKVPRRSEIRVGSRVKVLQKKDYASGRITEGIVNRILTSKPVHPRGIKVLLTSGVVGRVQALGDQPVIPLDNKPPLNARPFSNTKSVEPPGPDELV